MDDETEGGINLVGRIDRGGCGKVAVGKGAPGDVS
jgi:hypothetical protein